jgi:hypothetical protein
LEEIAMVQRMVLLSLVVVFTVAAAGCTLVVGTGVTPTVPPAGQLLPSLAGYRTVEGQLLTEYLGTISEGAALLAGHPELAASIGAVDQIITCYQRTGAIRARLYSDESEPLSAGTVAITDRDSLTDPQNLFRCLLPPAIAQSQALAIQPCVHSYTLERDDNAFYILYAGSTAEICSAFCTALEGCGGR